MEKEVWVNMEPPYEKYVISSYGIIKNTNNNCLLNLNDNKIGYIRINLCGDGKAKKYLLHRLIAKYFIEGFDESHVINHIDGNTFNNKICNLELCTTKENNNRKINKNYGKKSRKVAQYNLDGSLIKIWNNVKDLPSRQSVLKCLNGSYKTSGGFNWLYYSEIIEGEKWLKINIDGNTIDVSSNGRVKTKSGKICYYTTITKSGYASLHYNRIVYSVHRLICIAFNPVINRVDLVVNHKDMNKLNNNIDNLEWVTSSENTLHYNRNTNVVKNNFTRKIKRINDNDIFIYESNIIAAKENNISKGNINSCCNGKRKTAGGYKWEYCD